MNSVIKNKEIHSKMHGRLGFLVNVDGNQLKIEDTHDYCVYDVKTNEIECSYPLSAGDYLSLTFEANRIKSIVPKEQAIYSDQIRYLFDDFGILGNETVFTIGDGERFVVGDRLECERIRGEYKQKNNKTYAYRCISSKKIEPSTDRLSKPRTVAQVERDPGAQDAIDVIPEELVELLVNGKKQEIREKLTEILPADLSFASYGDHFHNLVYLEELNVLKEFENYARKDVKFSPKRNDEKTALRVFCLEFEDLHELRPSILKGDRVEATQTATREVFTGIVKHCNMDSMEIKFSTKFAERFDEAMTFDITFSYSRGMYKKLHHGIECAIQHLGEQLLFPKVVEITDAAQIDAHLGVDGNLVANGVTIPWFKQEIDASQKAAVVQALRGQFRPLPAIIHGPPGTGKTTTLIEIIAQTFTQKHDSRILVAAHSNSAANLILSRLIEHDFLKSHIIRLLSVSYQGKNKIPEALKAHCATIRIEMDNDDEDDPKEIDVKIVDNFKYLAPFRIVIGTCTGLGQLLYDRINTIPEFTHVVVDEAGQCSEPEIMIPISKLDIENGSIILAGDPMQMPPLVLSKFAKKGGLSISLLERFVDRYANIKDDLELNGTQHDFDLNLVSKLLYNYRSVPSLLAFYNERFYCNELIATVADTNSPEADILTRFQAVVPSNPERNLKHAIYFHNVEGKCRQMKKSNSWFNNEEITAVDFLTEELLQLGFGADDIGVITPYHLQVKSLRNGFADKKIAILVGSVDEFQGLEKKIIVISTVRSNVNKVELDILRNMGIVACPKRTNVAVSRARALVVVIGKAKLLERDENWSHLIKACKSNGTFY